MPSKQFDSTPAFNKITISFIDDFCDDVITIKLERSRRTSINTRNKKRIGSELK